MSEGDLGHNEAHASRSHAPAATHWPKPPFPFSLGGAAFPHALTGATASSALEGPRWACNTAKELGGGERESAHVLRGGGEAGGANVFAAGSVYTTVQVAQRS